jgi:hypothetical protein
MTELNKSECVVLLPSGQHFERLYDEIVSLAIVDANLIPSRIQRDFSSPLPIDLLIQQIAHTSSLFADLSENTPEIWMAVGCAIALKKPICLISSSQPTATPSVEQPPILSYPVNAFPSDYFELQQRITALLAPSLPQARTVSPTTPKIFTPEPDAGNPLPPPSVASFSGDLASYEVLALTIIDQKASHTGLSPRDLGLEMQASGSAHLTSHAINALKRRKFIERRPFQIIAGLEPQISENLFLTKAGEDWLIRSGEKAAPQPSGSHSREMFLTTL